MNQLLYPTSDTIIPILGIIGSLHGWVAHSDCMFRLLLHPSREFLKGLCVINAFYIHSECEDARVSCVECQSLISESLGISLGIFKMLKAYILRVERGLEYIYEFD
jgi:hypothetical protein